LAASGSYSKVESTGKHSVICCAGDNSIAKAQKGSWVTLSEWAWSKEEKRTIPVCVKTEYVDGERIKADTFYKLVNGNFTEV
jgi:predicted methyltransferase